MNEPTNMCPQSHLCGVHHCCHIGCTQPAKFTIYTPPWTYDGYTEMCGDHVAEYKNDGDVVERLEEVKK